MKSSNIATQDQIPKRQATVQSLYTAAMNSMRNAGEMNNVQLLQQTQFKYVNISPATTVSKNGREFIHNTMGLNVDYYKMKVMYEADTASYHIAGEGVEIYARHWNKNTVDIELLIETFFHELQHSYYKLHVGDNKDFGSLSVVEENLSKHYTQSFNNRMQDSINVFKTSPEGKQWIQEQLNNNHSSLLETHLNNIDEQYTSNFSDLDNERSI